MIYLYTIIAAFLMVAGQAFWKSASSTITNTLETQSIFIALSKTLFSWKFILGGLLYVVATLIYLYLFSKFQYNQVQLTLTSFAIILTILISLLLFKENLSLINFLGAAVIILGVLLVNFKK